MGSWRCTAAGVAPGVSGTVAGDSGTVVDADGTVACAGTPVAGTANAAEGAGATVTGVMVTAGAATEGAVPPCTVLPPRESAVAGGSSSRLSHIAAAMMATKTSSPLTTSNRKSHTFFMLYPCLPKAHPPAAITVIHGARYISMRPMPAFMGQPWAARHDLSKHVAPSSSASRQTDGRAERGAKHQLWTRLRSRNCYLPGTATNTNQSAPGLGTSTGDFWKRSGQHEPRKVSGHGAPFIEAVFQQANAYQRSRYSSDASRERSPLFRRTKASQAPANKKAPHKEALFIGEAITSSSWVPPSSPSGGLPGGASIRPGRFPRCRCAPVPAGECRTPGGPSHGRGSAG